MGLVDCNRKWKQNNILDSGEGPEEIWILLRKDSSDLKTTLCLAVMIK